jgi:gas vesicle protein
MEPETVRMRKDSSTNLIWFLAGIGLGTAVGMAFAPKPGAETRRAIGDYINQHGHDYYDRSRDLYERGRHLADEAAELFDEGRRLMETGDGQSEATGA